MEFRCLSNEFQVFIKWNSGVCQMNFRGLMEFRCLSIEFQGFVKWNSGVCQMNFRGLLNGIQLFVK